MATTKQKFDASSYPFLYSLIIAFLTMFAATGVKFPGSATDLAGQITTGLSSGGFYAIVGVIITSLIFPLFNFFVTLKGKFSFSTVFSKTSTWIAWGNAALAGVALTGFTLPDGTVEQIIGAVQAKDWMALISIFALTVGNTILRYLKKQNAN